MTCFRLGRLPSRLCVSLVVSLLAMGVTAEEPEPNPEEAAIRKSVQSYLEAFHAHDARALAAHWTVDGEYIMPSGDPVQGREAIEKEYMAYFAQPPIPRLEVVDSRIEFLSPSVATETGFAVVTYEGEEPATTEYVAVHTKTAEGWKMDSLREVDAADVQQINEHLQELDWMVGTWVDQSEDQDVRIEATCRWTKNHSFLTRTYRAIVEGRVDAEGTQVIGWDPIHQTIRSWTFESDGGFGAGAWSREGNRWLIRMLTVRPDGGRGSFTATMEKLDEDHFLFSTEGREVDGEVLPDIEPVTITRKQ